jgi:hypothetical protein
MDLTQLIDTYGAMKKDANELYKQYKGMQETLGQLQQELQAKLEETGLKSAKSMKYGVSTVTRRNILITDEHAVLEWLQNEPEVETDFYIGLKVTPFKTLATQYAKDTGEIIPGTDVEHKETISIRANERKQ